MIMSYIRHMIPETTEELEGRNEKEFWMKAIQLRKIIHGRKQKELQRKYRFRYKVGICNETTTRRFKFTCIHIYPPERVNCRSNHVLKLNKFWIETSVEILEQ